MQYLTKKIGLLLILSTLFIPFTTGAASKDKAYRLYSRINGTPPSQAKLNELTAMIDAKREREAALSAMNEQNFYNITLKNFAKPFTNTERTPRVPLNDYVATIVGMIRDDVPFDQVLYGDILYIAGPSSPIQLPVYDRKNNNMYDQMEKGRVSLKDHLVRVTQSTTTGIAKTAGVITTRAAANAFFSAGTNRRMTRFLFINYLCRDFEAVHDINVPDYRVRRDVERNPGGDSRTYKNQCVGCHAGQDGLGGAWAYYDFTDNEIKYTPGVVATKINKNIHYPENEVKDDSWENIWAQGQNANLGWPSVSAGKGAQELGMMLSRTRAFSECMAQRTFETFCLKKPSTSSEKNQIKALADGFQNNATYSMKNLIADTAVLCLGE